MLPMLPVLSPFPESFLPTYLPASSLPACLFYHLLCRFDMHVVLMGVNVFHVDPSCMAAVCRITGLL